MRQIILFFTVLLPLFGFSQDFETQWKEVDRLIGIRNYNETRPLIQAIKIQARSAQNSPEWIRAVLAEHFAVTTNLSQEAAFYRKRQHLLEHIAEANLLEKKVLENIYAMFLFNNFHYNRVQTDGGFLAWEQERRRCHIDSIFSVSLQGKSILLDEPIGKWKAMISNQKNQTLTPTLYHLLAYNHLDFLDNFPKQYKNKSEELTQSLQSVNKEKKYHNAASYVAFRPYQIMGDWQRKEHERQILTDVEQYPSDYNAQILLTLAQSYKLYGDAKAAMFHIETALTDYPNSPWYDNASEFEQQLKRASISMEMQDVSPSNVYIPIKIAATNSPKAYIRVYNVSTTVKGFRTYHWTYDSLTPQLNLPAELVYTDTISLKEFDDYKSHSTNFKINPLPFGQYKVLIANNAQFKDNGEDLDVSETDLIISDIFISPTIDKIGSDEMDYRYRTLLVNRKSGSPYRNKQLKLYDVKKKILTHIRNLRTNAYGEFDYFASFDRNKPELDDMWLFIPEENQLIPLDYLYDIPEHVKDEDNEDDDEPQKDALVLTDRAIYRPGQEVFFKVIAYTKDLNKGKLNTNEKIRIVLRDANNQIIDSIQVATNTFGSAHGSFRIPSRTLNGNFTIEFSQGDNHQTTKSIKVEEYKKPTFRIEFDENKLTYTKLDTATFTGHVKSLSGANLGHIAVKYNVSFANKQAYRQIKYVDTVTNTDSEGRFTLRIPLTDSVFSEHTDFTLQFRAEAINHTGEIQTTSTQYRYADKPLQIKLAVQSPIVEKKWNNIVVKTTNPNGHPIAAKGIVNVYRYEDANIIQSNRKTFDFVADYHLLDSTGYQIYFPWYFDKIYLSKERPRKLIESYTFDSKGTDTLKLSQNYTYGSYIVEAYTIHDNDTTKTNHTVEVLSSQNHKISDKDFLVIRTDKQAYIAHETLTVHFQTDFKDASGIYLWKVQGSTKNKVTFVPFKNGKASYAHRISPKDIQVGSWFEIMMIQENKIVTRRLNIPIKTIDKSLLIKTQTFRDKITPGVSEQWSFTVNDEGKPTKAEVVASMYDSALDQFAENSFPTSFDLRQPYYWQRIYSGWNTDAFHHKSTTGTVFSKPNRPYNTAEYAPTFMDYGLGSAYNEVSKSFAMTGSVSTLQEIVVTGYSVSVAHELQGAVAGISIRGSSTADAQQPLYIIDGQVHQEQMLEPSMIHEITILKDAEATAIYGSRAANGVIIITTKEGHKLDQLKQVEPRSNLQETAFFYPNLLTDRDGQIRFEFNGPEALTRWKLQLFAHTETLQAGTASFFAQTQKQLMVRPNLPRYLREGDEIVIHTQIQNLSDSLQTGTARLEVINPENNDVISTAFFVDNGLRDFSVTAQGNSTVSWHLRIPEGIPIVQIKIVGASGDFSDGEMHELAILPNRILVTDTEKIILDSGENKEYNISARDKENLQATIQVQSNPILEIISALDYLKNYPYECNEQTASKWYGLKMLQYIQDHYPAVHNYFANINPKEVDSKLEENSKLSELLTEEMPWIRQIKNDKESVKSLAKLFKTNYTGEIVALEKKLEKAQLDNGAFPWFESGKPDTHISLRLLEVFGKVYKLDPSLVKRNISNIAAKLIHYLDQDSSIYGPMASTDLVLDYLYVRTLWNHLLVLPAIKTEELRKYIDLSATYTAQQPAGMAAKAWLVNALYDYRIASIEVKNRIAQEVIYDEDRGMYWESNAGRYNEMALQSYMVEAYQQLDTAKLDQITQWIYYRKQHNHWQTTWNTVDAVYALLLANNPKDFVLDNTVSIQIDNQQREGNDQKVLGYISTQLQAEDLTTDKKVQITNHNNRKIYVGIYHQYFMPLDAVRSRQKELSVSKKIFVRRDTSWVEAASFKTGDRIKIQLVIVNNEPLSYVHLRDGRAVGFEPIYQPSGYQYWKGYYFTIKDASTNYFFNYLPKGRHVYEYEVKTNNTGIFSSGIAQIECMYEPTVNARSSNVQVRIDD